MTYNIYNENGTTKIFLGINVAIENIYFTCVHQDRKALLHHDREERKLFQMYASHSS